MMDEDIERVLFERWFKQTFNIAPVRHLLQVQTHRGPEYVDRITQYSWDGWKARGEMT